MSVNIIEDGRGNIIASEPVPVEALRDARKQTILAQLTDLDRLTMHRAMELWAKQFGDNFVKAKIAEKEALRDELASLNE